MAGVQTTVRRDSAHPSVAKRVASSNDDWFEPDELKSLRDYHRPLRIARRSRIALSTLVELIVVFGVDLPARIDRSLDAPWPVQIVVIGFVLGAISSLVAAPFSAWANLVYEKRAGHSTMTPATWIKDQGLELVLGAVIDVAMVVPLFAAVRAFELWWIAGTVLVVAFMALFAFVYPVLIMPRYNKFTPMPEGEIRSRIEEIAALSDVQIEGVYLMDASKRTTRPNAGVTGFGKTKRVVVNDTICDFPIEELSQVISHELGHYRLNHIPKRFPLSALQFPIVLLAIELIGGNATVLDWAGASALGDPSSYGVFQLVFGLAIGVVALPGAWLSRKHEREADLEALELLGDPTSFLSMWPRMVLGAEANLEPSWYERAKGTHPEIAERLQFGLDWAVMNGVPVTRPARRSIETDEPAAGEPEPAQ